MEKPIQPILDKALAGERLTSEDCTDLLESNDFVRIGLAGAAEAIVRKAMQAEIGRIERLLARQDERRRNTPRDERVGKRSEFDCFRPGADHQPNFSGTQPSP